VSDDHRWHWDEQRALRELLAEQTEAAASELVRLGRQVDHWRERAERAEARERVLCRLLARALMAELDA
jgi:hypothetical protein